MKTTVSYTTLPSTCCRERLQLRGNSRLRFVKDSNEIRVQDIRSINVTKHGIGGLIGIGTIEFSSAATDDAEVTFVGIAGADGVRDMVRKLQNTEALPKDL